MDENLSLKYILDKRAALMVGFNKRLRVLRDYVVSAALDYATGLYLFGRPGTAKTYTVKTVLDEVVREPYVYKRGYLTPLGLFKVIRRNPCNLIVLDDLATVLDSEVALQILLASLEHPTSSDRSRIVEYERLDREERVAFSGSIIVISNRELHGGGLLDAFRSRVHTLNYNPSNGELGALMLNIADGGWPPNSTPPEINPESARMVAEYLIAEMLRLACPFDLRLLVNKAFPDFQQWKDGEAESNWRDLITASIEEHLVAVKHCEESPLTREARKAEEWTIIEQIHRDHSALRERIKAWKERTQKSERAYYRRRAEMQ